ncbi:MAG: class I SAM-dependent methyltransferase, partial [Candidatus Aenigmarchaeota archaeon]|nr:class I SAM-dependent methyltransferase [Candidatus Aenigmarchaeota archaeon]
MRERFDAKTSEELGKWYDMAFSKGNLKMKGNFYPKMLAWINLPSDNSKKLLDIACGSGFLLKEAEKQVDTYGIDISHVAIKEAEKIAKNSNIKVGTAEKLPYKDNFFDYVICLGSLEHFINMEKGLSEMRRVMKPNAIANILVPNSDYLIFKFIGQPPLY